MTTKTTVYLPDNLKKAIENEAKRQGCSEAQVIRDALTTAIVRPRPNAGIFQGELLADRVDDLLVGFGER